MKHFLEGLGRWLAPAGVPFAWRQLCFDRNRLLAATCGIILAVTSILFQTGANNALFAGVATQYLALNADLVMHSADYKYVVVHAPFPRDRIAAVLADPDVESAGHGRWNCFRRWECLSTCRSGRLNFREGNGSGWRLPGREIVDLLQRLAREEDCALILITHDQRILSIADRLLHLEDGLLSGGNLETESAG
jgi:hypothetical protein